MQRSPTLVLSFTMVMSTNLVSSLHHLASTAMVTSNTMATLNTNLNHLGIVLHHDDLHHLGVFCHPDDFDHIGVDQNLCVVLHCSAVNHMGIVPAMILSTALELSITLVLSYIMSSITMLTSKSKAPLPWVLSTIYVLLIKMMLLTTFCSLDQFGVVQQVGLVLDQ